MNALRSTFPCSLPSTIGIGDTSRQSSVRVKVLVLGAGPVGLFAMRQLEGLQLYHNEVRCPESNQTRISERKVLIHDMPPHSSCSNIGKMQSGRKLASLYDVKTQSYKPCLECQFNSEQKVEWMVCSDEPVGGSWNAYLPSQQTLSDFREMGLPDFPIERCDVHKIPLPPPPLPCQRVVTDGESLVKYYQEYGKRMMVEPRAVSGRVVCASQAGSVWQEGLFWEVRVRSAAGEDVLIGCDYLILAVGKKAPKWLNISGERANPYVSHWTHDACRAMDRLKPQSEILVVGDGYSACDTIYEAWQKGMKVTHLLPSKVKEEAISVAGEPGRRGWHGLIQHLNHKRSVRHYSVAEAMAYPEKYPLYEQGLDCQLVGIENYRKCHILQKQSGASAKSHHVEYDHIALLTGVKADFSFFPEASRSSLFQSDGTLSLCSETMESRGCKNLFIIGFGAGESFLYHALGHAVAAVETIRKREQEKQAQMMRCDEVVPMECDD